MGWIGCIRCKKFQRDFGARTFAQVRPVLHRVRYGNQTVPNAPKKYESHQNISLWSNGVDRVRSLRKIPTLLRGTYFCTIRPFCTEFCKATKRSQMHPNTMKCTKISFLGTVGWIALVRCEKFRRVFILELLH